MRISLKYILSTTSEYVYRWLSLPLPLSIKYFTEISTKMICINIDANTAQKMKFFI